jgi:hypothetical protein
MAGERITFLRRSSLRSPLVLIWGAWLLLGPHASVSLIGAKPNEEKDESLPQQEKKHPDPLLQLIRSLTPEQKAKLMESIRTWQQLGPELKASLRARDKAIKKSLSDEVQAAFEGSSFTKEQKELFEKRYKEERRRVESSLRSEFEARRKVALEELVNSLKKSVLYPEKDSETSGGAK